MNAANRITEPEVERDAAGKVTAIQFAFGPHYFVHVEVQDKKAVWHLGATHQC